MAEERQYEEIEAPQQRSDAAENAEAVQADDDGTMSLVAHLTELRSRLIKCLIAIGLGSCVGYYFIDEIMHYLTLPAGKLYYMQPSEAFFTYLKVAVVAGFLLALPIVFYQVWRFFLPALTAKERMVLGIIVPTSVILFFSGLAFSFFLVLPAGIRFFMGFGNAELEALFSVNKYFDFVITFVLPFGFVFELPLVPLCDEDCKGLCPTCGANLNEGPCGCEKEQSDGPDECELAKNPFAALANFSFDSDESAD